MTECYTAVTCSLLSHIAWLGSSFQFVLDTCACVIFETTKSDHRWKNALRVLCSIVIASTVVLIGADAACHRTAKRVPGPVLHFKSQDGPDSPITQVYEAAPTFPVQCSGPWRPVNTLKRKAQGIKGTTQPETCLWQASWRAKHSSS